jgi:hypothetical protein
MRALVWSISWFRWPSCNGSGILVGEAIAFVSPGHALLPALERIQHMSDSRGYRFSTTIVHWVDCLLLRDVSHETWPRSSFAIHGIFKVLESTVSFVCRRAVAIGRYSWACFCSYARPGRLLVCLKFESGSHSFVPSLHRIVWSIWEALFGEHFWKDGARRWVHHIVLLDCSLQKWHVFFRTQQQLYGLPCHKTLLLQRRYGRASIAVIVWRRLETVECAERFVDECD